MLHLPTGALVGDIRYLRSCEEIYDVQVLPGMRSPGLLGIADDKHRGALSTQGATYWVRDEPGRQEPALGRPKTG